METFKLKSSFINSKYIHFLYPLMVLVLSIVIMSTPFIGFSNYAPIIIIASVAWTIYDIYKIASYKKFFVTVSDQEININNKSVLKWENISSVTFYSVGFGMQGIVVFNNDKAAKVPAVIENLELLKNKIQKNLQESCTVINK